MVTVLPAFLYPTSYLLKIWNACTIVSKRAIPLQIVCDPGGPCDFLLMYPPI